MAAPSFSVGQKVKVAGRFGVVRFCGLADFKDGEWVGVELNEPVGKNNGTVAGKAYFTCPDEHGIFVRPTSVAAADDAEAAAPAPSSKAAPSAKAAGPKAAAPKADAAKAAPPKADAAKAAAPAQARAASRSTLTKAGAAAAAAPPTPRSSTRPAAAADPAAQKKAPGKPAASSPAKSPGLPPADAPPAAAAPAAAPAPRASVQSAAARAAPAAALARPSVSGPSARAAAPAAAKAAAPQPADAPAGAPASAAPAEPEEPIPEPEPSAAELALPELRSRLQELRKAKDEILAKIQAEQKLLSQAEAAHKAAEAAAEKAQHARDAELEGAMSAASMKAKAEENANRMKDAVKKLCSEVSVLRTIKGKLQLPPTSPLASLEVDAVLDDAEVEKDLEDQLQAMVLSRMLAQERLLDAELDRQQLEDDIEIRGDELARKAMDVGGDMTAQYQEAIRTVDAASSKELNLLKAKVEELSKASQKESRLREREEEVRIELEQLEDRIDKLDEENSRMQALQHLGKSLHDASEDVESQLSKLLEMTQERVLQLEDLLQKLFADNSEARAKTTEDAERASSLRSQVRELTQGAAAGTAAGGGAASLARAASLQVRRQLADLEGSTARELAAASASCLPRGWLPQAGAGGKESFSKALSLAEAVATVERCSSLAGALTAQLGTGRLAESATPWLCQLCVVSGRCARSAAAALEALRSAPMAPGAHEALLSLEQRCGAGARLLSELLSAGGGSGPPPQPLAPLLELDGHMRALRGALLVEGAALPDAPGAAAEPPWPRAGLGLALRQLEGSYRYGAAAGGSEQGARLGEIAVRLGALAGAVEHLGDAAGATGGAADGEAAPSAAELPQALAQQLQALEGLCVAVSAGAGSDQVLELLLAAPTLVSEALDAMDLAVGKRARAGRGRARGSRPAPPPAWTRCCEEVHKAIHDTFAVQKEVAEARERLGKEQSTLDDLRQELQAVEDRQSALKQQMGGALEGQQRHADLEKQVERLRADAKRDAEEHAELGRELSAVRAEREAEECRAREAEAERDGLRQVFEEKKRGPQQDSEGRATPQQLAALQRARGQRARELYALQVGGLEDLEPLPQLGPQRPAPEEACLQRYAELRRRLLQEWSGVRVADACAEGGGSLAEAVLRQRERAQALRLLLSEAQAEVAAAPCAEAAAVSSAAQPAGAKAARLELHVPCPSWALSVALRGPVAVGLGQLHELHRCAAA